MATMQHIKWTTGLLCCCVAPSTPLCLLVVVVVVVDGVTHTLGHGMDGTTQAGVVLIDASHPIVVVVVVV